MQPIGKPLKSARKYFNENKQNNYRNAQKKGAKSAKTDCTRMYRIYLTSTFQTEPLFAIRTSDFARRFRQDFLSCSEQFPHLHTQCFGYPVEGRSRWMFAYRLQQSASCNTHLIRKFLLRITLLLYQFLDSMLHNLSYFLLQSYTKPFVCMLYPIHFCTQNHKICSQT